MMTKKFKRQIILFPVIILTIFAGLYIYPKVGRHLKERPIKNPDTLRSEIVKSIRNPFKEADTLILETDWMFCGNSNPDELPVVFDTKLQEENYMLLLSRQVNKPVITMTEFNKVMDEVRNNRFNGDYPPSLWNTCRLGKVSADIKAQQLSPRQVRLFEYYLYADTAKYIQKDFTFHGDKWTYSITNHSTEVLSK